MLVLQGVEVFKGDRRTAINDAAKRDPNVLDVLAAAREVYPAQRSGVPLAQLIPNAAEIRKAVHDARR